MPTLIATVTNDLSQDQRMHRICGSLQANGYEVTLVGRRLAHSLPLAKTTYQQVRLSCWFTKGKFFYLEYNLRLCIYLLWQRPDMVNAVDLDTLLPGYCCQRLTGVKLFYDAHEYFTETPEVVRRPRTQRIWSALADWLIPKVDGAYTVGPALAQLFGERYGLPFGVVRNVPVARPQKRDPTPAQKIILYQGMLNEGRGLEVAIAAMQHLPSHELWLVGYGDVASVLRRQIADLQLAERVRFLGFVPPAELPALTAQAWLGLNLLENNGLSYYYSLANKAFDYIQAGLPSVQMDFPEYRALQETYEPFVLLKKLDATSLVGQVKALHDEKKYQQLVANCESAARQLTWQTEEKQLLLIYHQVH